MHDALNRLRAAIDSHGTNVFVYTNFGAFDGALAAEDGPWNDDRLEWQYAHGLP